MRAIAMYIFAALWILAGLILLLSWALLAVDDWRRENHKPVSEWRRPSGKAPGA